jgi:cell division ATPase FtsA
MSRLEELQQYGNVIAARQQIAMAVLELAETLLADGELSFSMPESVVAVGNVLKAAGMDEVAEKVAETSRDEWPDEWRRYDQEQADAAARQHDEDEAREGGNW